MNDVRKLTLGAAAAIVAAAAAAGAALAHPHPAGGGDGKKVERVVVIRDRDGHGDHGKPGHRVRRFEIRGGELAGCEGGEKIVDESAGEGDKKTKVIICTKGAPTAASAKHLEDALARIRANDELSDEQKAKIETALRAAIDRARSAR